MPLTLVLGKDNIREWKNKRELGKEGIKQGICGFISVMQAVYSESSSVRSFIRYALPSGQLPDYRHEISLFLRELDRRGEHKLLYEIEQFTQTFEFKEYGQFRIQKYMAGVHSPEQFGIYSLAMTPEALIRYIQLMWHRPAVMVSCSNPALIPPFSIIGVGYNKMLRHYVYKDGAGNIFSWGTAYTDIDEFMKESCATVTRDKYTDILFYIRIQRI